jgi:NAD(P)-dependent dehydrogenase (short-subunit alcohol dehydrogenase family)
MQLDASISAVITGGASGLGAATARRLAARGVRVALFDLNEAAGQALAREIGGLFCRVDVTDEASVDAGFAQARAAQGQERILVNCAGTGNAVKTASRDKATGEIRHFPVASFDRIIQINLVGSFRCIAKSAAGMLTLEPLADGERGAIVNTASVAAQDGQMGQASYSASKAGHDPAHRARPHGRGHPREHHPAGHLRYAAAAGRARQREGRPGRLRPVPQAPGPAR